MAWMSWAPTTQFIADRTMQDAMLRTATAVSGQPLPPAQNEELGTHTNLDPVVPKVEPAQDQLAKTEPGPQCREHTDWEYPEDVEEDDDQSGVHKAQVIKRNP